MSHRSDLRSLSETYLFAYRCWRTVLSAWLGLFALTATALAQGILSNGALQSGSLSSAGKTDSWTFSATAGGTFMVRVGATNLAPKFQVFDPSNSPIGQASPPNGNYRDIHLTLSAAASGTYTVLVSASVAAQVGTYGISLAQAPGLVTVTPGDQGGSLTSGTLTSGQIAVGDLDVWTFSAKAGDALMLRAGGTNVTPWIRLYGPDGGLVQEANGPNGNYRDSFLTALATNSGPYTVILSAGYLDQSGGYGLTLAQIPAPPSVAPGDEGGVLTNGLLTAGQMELGDLDVWTFGANAGDSLILRAGATNFTPWIRLYAPDGSLVQEGNGPNGNYRDTVFTGQATNSGTYTVVLSAGYAGQSGSYGLNLAQVPAAFSTRAGDEGGELINGKLSSGQIEWGDLDMWSFSAKAGDALMLRAGATNFTPWIRLYGPDGALVQEGNGPNGNYRDTAFTARATNSGPYTVVLEAGYVNQSGSYGLTLAQVPASISVGGGDQGGVLTNGVLQAGQIELGDLDLWSFSAQAGDAIMLRAGATNFTPWIRLYAPDGSLVAEGTGPNGNYRDSFLTAQGTNSGSYTVALEAAFANQSGSYGLSLVQVPAPIVTVPGDEGGPLSNGVTNAATLALGDLDVWSFYGTPGDSNALRVTAVDFSPWIRLYGPEGSLVKEVTPVNGNVRAGTFNQVITNAGIYTVVISAGFANQAGTYTFKQSRVPPDLNVPADVTVDEGGAVNVSISAQDPDVPDRPLAFALLSPPPGMTLTLAGATNAVIAWSTTEATGPSTNPVIATVTDVVDGKAYIRTNSFTVVVHEINTPPQLTVPPTAALDEATPLNLTATATDADLPPNPLSFSLVGGPEGLVIDAQSGALSWIPTEGQGPGVYTFGVVVTDDSPSAANAVHLSVTNGVTVTVREVNSPPVLPSQSLRTIDELTTLTVTNTAADSDLPANTLTYVLLNAPANAVISPQGIITWTPSEAQGPSTNTFTTVVTDNGVPSLSVTNSFRVIVNETNSAPVLPTQPARTISELSTLIVTNTASDSDLPANTLTYVLVGAPTNAVISAEGLITWTPTEVQGPSTNTFTTIVTDSGTPSLSATNSFSVVVTEVNTAPVLQPISDRSLHYGADLSIQASASDADLPPNVLTYTVDQGPSGLVVDSKGLITWKPGQDQVGTHPVTLRVSDNGTPAASATVSFQVVVTGEGVQLSIQPLSAGLVQVIVTGDTGYDYELQKSADLTAWDKLVQFSLATSPFPYVDPESAANNRRFYRLKLLKPTGQ